MEVDSLRHRNEELEQKLARANLTSLEVISDLTEQLDKAKRLVSQMSQEKSMLKDELSSCVSFHRHKKPQEATTKPKFGKLKIGAHDVKERSLDALCDDLEDDLQRIITQYLKSTSSAVSPEKPHVVDGRSQVIQLAPLHAQDSSFADLPVSPAKAEASFVSVDEHAEVSKQLQSANQQVLELKLQFEEASRKLEQSNIQHQTSMAAVSEALNKKQAEVDQLLTNQLRDKQQITSLSAEASDTLAKHLQETNQLQASLDLVKVQLTELQSMVDHQSKEVPEQSSVSHQSAPLGLDANLASETTTNAADKHDSELMPTTTSIIDDSSSVVQSQLISELQLQLSMNQHEVEQLRSQADNLSAQLATARLSILKYESSTNSDLLRLSELDSLSVNLKAQLEESIKQLQFAQSDGEQMKNSLNAQIDALQQQLLRETSRSSQLSNDLLMAKQALSALETIESSEHHEVEVKSSQMEQLLLQIAALQEQLCTCNTETQSLIQSKTALLSELELERVRANDLASANHDVSSKVTILAQQLELTKAQLQKSEEEISALVENSASQSRIIAELHASISEMRESVISERQSWAKESDEIEQSLQAALASKTLVTAELLQAQTRLEKYKTEATAKVLELSSAIDGLNAQIDSLKQELGNEHEISASRKLEVDNLSGQLLVAKQAEEEHQTELAALEDAWESEKSDNTRLKEDSLQLHTEIDRLNLKLVQTEHDLRCSSETITHLRSELDVAKERNASLRSENESTKAENFTLAQDSEVSKQTIFTLREEIESLNQRNVNLGNEASSLRQTVDAVRLEYSALQAVINDLAADTHTISATDASTPSSLKKLRLKLELLESELRSCNFTLEKCKEVIKERDAELVSVRSFFEHQKGQYDDHLARVQEESKQQMLRMKATEEKFIQTTVGNMNMVNTLNMQVSKLKSDVNNLSHERQRVREQLLKSISMYKEKLNEVYMATQKKEKRRFFKLDKHKDAMQSQAQQDFDDFEAQIARLLEALDKHVLEQAKPVQLVSIDSLGLL